MAGMELFRRIRSEKSEVAVVILTGFGSLGSAVQSVRWKAEDYLTKPCSLADIDQALSRVLARKRENDRSTHLSEAVDAGIGLLDEAPTRPPVLGGPTLADMERGRILEALERHSGNKPAVAAELGISLRTLYNRVNAYRLEGFKI
jgi:DNA-binding NtrC family response regulator